MLPKELDLKNGQKLVIRTAEINDAADLIEYLRQMGDETKYLLREPDEFDMTVKEEQEFIKKRLDKPNKLHILAEIDGRIVGALGYDGGDFKRSRHKGELGVSVLKAYWGMGIGTALMEVLIEWAKESDIIRKLNLKVRADNARARELYERFGFKQEGYLTREFIIDGEFYDGICMGMHID